MEMGLIVGMISFGFAATVGEKIFTVSGKPELASFINLSGLVGLGLTTVGLVSVLIKNLGTLL